MPRPTPGEAKLRSAGHFSGSKAADPVIAEGVPLSAAAKALIALGVDGDDIGAWTEACAELSPIDALQRTVQKIVSAASLF